MISRLLKNKWSSRIIAFLFALFLFIFVRDERTAHLTTVSNQQTTSVESVETISNVPVYLGDHEDNIYISGLPETVAVRLSGPRNLLNQITAENLKIQTESLMGTAMGTRTVRLESKGLPEGVRIQITPSQAYATIAQKVTMTVPIQYEVAPEVAVDKYYVGAVTLNPAEVTLTGTQEAIKRFAQAKIRISSSQAEDKTFTSSYKLQLLDDEGKLLDLSANVTDIEATVEISQKDKSIDLNIVPVGEDVENYTYRYRFVDSSSVVVHGQSSRLDALKKVDVRVDVSGIEENKEVIGVIELPSDDLTVDVEEVKVMVFIEPKNE